MTDEYFDEPDTQARELITKARTSIVMRMPFFAALALRLYYKQQPKETVPTAAVDGINFFYNADFVKSLNQRQLMFLVTHEAMHCALSHMSRRQERDPEKWNIACDHVINILIDDYNNDAHMRSVMEYPPGILMDRQYTGLSAEEVYARLPEPTDEEKEAGAWGAVLEAPSTNDTDNNPNQVTAGELDQQWQIATRTAVESARMQGNLPGSLEETLGEALKPKVNWQEKLRRFMTSHDKSGFSWSRVNKRYLPTILPSRWSRAVGKVVVAIDTSCSVSSEELRQFEGEVNHILSESKPKEVTVIFCDTSIKRIDTYKPTDLPVKLKVKGRGGTAFEPVFDYVAEKNMDIECLMYMTDLGANTNFPPPRYPVMWINTYRGAHTPAWGEKVDLILN